METRDDPGGQPRRYRPLERLDAIFDADPVDATLYLAGRLPGTPRAYRRERRNSGGTLALIRDVSASMEGRLSRWSGEVVAGGHGSLGTKAGDAIIAYGLKDDD